MHWRKKYEKKSFFFLCCIAGVPILSRPPVSRWIALYSVSRKVWSKTHRGRLSDKKSEETKKRSVKFSTAWINVPRVVRREKFYRSKEEWYSVLWQKIVKLLHAVCGVDRFDINIYSVSRSTLSSTCVDYIFFFRGPQTKSISQCLVGTILLRHVQWLRVEKKNTERRGSGSLSRREDRKKS